MQQGEICNLWREIEFVLDGLGFCRTLVPVLRDPAGEISVDSPVGHSLLTASPGESLIVQAPGGEIKLEVLSVTG